MQKEHKTIIKKKRKIFIFAANFYRSKVVIKFKIYPQNPTISLKNMFLSRFSSKYSPQSVSFVLFTGQADKGGICILSFLLKYYFLPLREKTV
ncbi:MAG TPA: hypothetical protein DEF88_10125 [Porphyromonadaceae bacterium]|nr:hypothetical protein [Porphyromonadaceae bacterium]HBK33114.1 hypothetical protein [Porphyromonadaceae bacterium]HBX20788.1 hypothetical protein [Porphyromonadaceae bacterium]